MKKIRKICCIGAGYVGGPTMAVIADKCPHLEINVVDINKNRIKAWNDNDLSKLPIFEPGLEEIIKKRRNQNLFFSTQVENQIKNADMIFISVNTPTKTHGIGAGFASDLRWIESCARQIAKYAEGHTIIVEKSTLPVRTAEKIKSILDLSLKGNKPKNSNPQFSVLSNPEFLAEGTAIDDLINPDRILIGGDDIEAIKLLEEIYSNWIDKNKILKTNIWSSELSKLIANAFLAQRISSINSVSALCEKTGANVNEVSRAIGMDSRIGNKFLNAGPGFGGSCFKKDILNLIYICEFYGLKEVAKYWESVLDINYWQQNRISSLVIDKLFGTITGKKISIFGFAFKSNTNDTRESPAINICKNFLNEGCELLIYDPKVNEKEIASKLGKNEKNVDPNIGNWHKSNTIKDSVKNADAIVVLTEWEEFKKIKWDQISELMRKPAWVFDTRNICKKQGIEKSDINFWQIGISDEEC